MAIITLPTKFGFGKVSSFKLQRATNILSSKYTGQAQVIVFPYAVWMLKAQLIEYDGLDAGKIRSFLAQLEGQKNTFRLPVPGYSKPSTNNVNANCLTLNTAAARASSITCNSLPASANIFNEGDYFTIQDELKMVTAAVASNGFGQATISFTPPLRKAVAASVSVILINPTCIMRAADDDVASWGIMPPIRFQTGFDAVEAVDI